MHLSGWLQYDRLHLLVFLTDILSLLKSFQKTCQSDTISILDVLQLKASLFEKLQKCKAECVPAGWEQLFLQNVVKDKDNYSLYGINLKKNISLRSTRRGTSLGAYQFTTAKRQHIINSLIQNLNIRLGLDESIQDKLKPMAKISSSTTHNDLKMCYMFIAKDLSEDSFFSDYYEAAELLKEFDCTTVLESLRKLHEICPDRLHTIKCALARIVAAKPNPADVERLISMCKISRLSYCN